MYGLKQAGHEWFKMLCSIMKVCGIHQCIGYEGTYVCIQNQTMVGTHGDDLIGIVATKEHLDEAEQLVERQVELDKRGKPSKMLGIELQWTKEEVVLTQRSLIESIVKKHLGNGDTGGKQLLPLNPQSYEPGDEKEQEHPEYHSLVEGLLFIARMTRPDIAIYVNLLGRRTSDHTPENWQAAKQVWTKSDGLRLRKAKDLRI